MVDAVCARRLKDVDGAGHVDLGAQDRIGAAEGHLQRRQVNHARDAVLGENRLQRIGIAQVALHEGDRRLLLGAHQPIDALAIFALIELTARFPLRRK